MIDWEPRQTIEAAYRRAIQSLMNKFMELIPLDIEDPYDIGDLLQTYASSDIFQEFAHATARKMVTGLFVDGSRTWREAAQESGMGKMLRAALARELEGPVGIRMQQLIDENAELISSFPLNIAKEVNEFVREESLAGRRAATIASSFREQFPEVTAGRIALISRTETGKTSTALIRARAEEIDLNWYEWETSQDQRVRRSHRKMQSVLVNWNDPPSPEMLIGEKPHGHYHAGNIYNCRCYPAPVVRFDLLQWPAKVYYGGHVQYMTFANFRRVAGAIFAEAA